MKLMKQTDWDKYIQTMNDWQEDAFQQKLVWKRFITYQNKHGEDNKPLFEDVELKGLLHYNYFRAWSVTQSTTTGEIDKESCLLYFNKKYLKEQGYIKNDNTFDFDPAMDRFILDGITYKSTGESQAGQAHDSTLFYFLVLKREETNTGDNRYGY